MAEKSDQAIRRKGVEKDEHLDGKRTIVERNERCHGVLINTVEQNTLAITSISVEIEWIIDGDGIAQIESVQRIGIEGPECRQIIKRVDRSSKT